MAIDLGTGLGCIHYKGNYPFMLDSRTGVKLWLANENFYMPHVAQIIGAASEMQNGCQNLVATELASVTLGQSDIWLDTTTSGQAILFCAAVTFPGVTGLVQYIALTYSDGDQEFLWVQDLSAINQVQDVVNQNIILSGPAGSDLPLLQHVRIQ